MRLGVFLQVMVFLLFLLLPKPGRAAPVAAGIVPGLNVTAVTAPLAGQASAFPLLAGWKESGITAVESYDPIHAKMLRAELDGSGSPAGDDFPLVENAALFVYSSVDAALDLGTVTSCSPLEFTAGFNLAGFACFPSPFLASEFLHSAGLANISSISRLDALSGRWQTAAVDGGTVAGEDFPLTAGEGYVVYATAASVWQSPVPEITGLNPLQLSVGTTATQVAISGMHFRSDSVVSVDGVDVPATFVDSTLLKTVVPAQAVSGSLSISVRNPDAYHAGGFFLSKPATLVVTHPPIGLLPGVLTVWQGQPDVSLTVSIAAPAPAGGTVIGLVSSDPTLAAVPSQVTIVQGATSAVIPLTLPDTGSSAVQSVTLTASAAGMNSADARLSVRPKPTINLSPLNTLTGLTFTYLLTVNLSDVAPPVGFPVTLLASPTGIVSLPASVTIPAGQTSAQVTVTATAVGSASISATSPGRGFSGAQHTVTVTPIQTMNYGPVTTAPVGVNVQVPVSPGGSNMAYGPVASGRVGVVVGSTVTGVVPPTGATGATNMQVTVTGVGLSAATDIGFQPPTGITVHPGSFAVNAGGNPEVTIDIDPAAPTLSRTVVVMLPAGAARPGAPGANTFRVTLPEPQILGMQPTRAMAGQVISLKISGKNLTSASSIDFIPADGITVSNPPTVNAAGDTATATVIIAANAPVGNRVVTITTPGWTSSATPSVGNTFEITADAGITYTPITSREVGVAVQQSTSSTTVATYGPVASGRVGVVVGSTVTGVVPPTGATGATNMKVTVTGVGLSAASGIDFQPQTGITVHPGSFAVNADGNPEVTIDIDPAAPTLSRTVVVMLPAGAARPGAPGANTFRVTLPEPQILGMQPIRAMAGQVISLKISGKNLTSASSIDFIPADGITVSNPPTVNAAGDTATATVIIAANAPVGNRVVTITTPGWTSSATPSVGNTFEITADAGITYTPITSREVGIVVQKPYSINYASMAYGPVASTEVGVLVEPQGAPTSKSFTYGPVISTEVGVVVGGALSGLAPRAIEPGTTVTVTLTGAGLDQATAFHVVPSTGITVGTWTPAADGLSGSIEITADATTPLGPKTLVAQTPGGTIIPASVGAGELLVGYRPTINSILPILPTVGTNFTLTINGVHLQGATKVEILPPENVIVDSIPVWSSDGTGEHLTVKVFIDSGALPGDRVVVVTTPYGVTTDVGSPANIMTFYKPGVALLPQTESRVQVVDARHLYHEPAQVLPIYREPVSALSGRRGDQRLCNDVVTAVCLIRGAPLPAQRYLPEVTDSSGYRYAAYRGPPVHPATERTHYPRRMT